MKSKNLKLFLLMLLTSPTLLAQKQSVYSKTYEVNDNTTAFFKLSDGSVDVEIELSTDGKFHVDYDIDFKEYPKRERKEVLDKIKIKAKLVNNHITLLSETNYNHSRYSDFFQEIIHKYKKKQIKENIFIQKSKDSLLKEITKSKIFKPLYLDFIENSTIYNQKQKEKALKRHKKRENKRFKKSFVIKIPSNIKLTIEAKSTGVKINNNFKNQLSIRLDKGKFLAESLKNKNNVIKIEDAVFIVEEIGGGQINLKNIKKGQIGSLSNVKLDAEFSNIEIGEIQKNNHFKGFRNEIIFHNFSDNFEQFNFSSEYSKLHYFKTDNNFILSANGYNTMVTTNDKIEKLTNKKNGKKNVFFETKKNKNEKTGKINLDIIHGFIYFH